MKHAPWMLQVPETDTQRAAREGRQEARRKRAGANFRRANAGQLGRRLNCCGPGLVVGTEWETSDGFRVRLVDAIENPLEPGHYIGTIEVIGFAADKY